MTKEPKVVITQKLYDRSLKLIGDLMTKDNRGGLTPLEDRSLRLLANIISRHDKKYYPI